MLYCTHQVVEVESVWRWRVDKCSCVATPDLSPSNTFPEFLRLIWLSSNFRFFFFCRKSIQNSTFQILFPFRTHHYRLARIDPLWWEEFELAKTKKIHSKIYKTHFAIMEQSECRFHFPASDVHLLWVESELVAQCAIWCASNRESVGYRCKQGAPVFQANRPCSK